MWNVYCADCGHAVLLAASQVRGVTNLASGVIAVELRCPAGHRVQILTGATVHDRGRVPPTS